MKMYICKAENVESFKIIPPKIKDRLSYYVLDRNIYL